jgi:hypothetical protein
MALALKPGGWAVFSVPLLTSEGRFFYLNELVARRQVYLRSPEETVRSAKRAGLRVEQTGVVGTSLRGLTLVVQAHA